MLDTIQLFITYEFNYMSSIGGLPPSSSRKIFANIFCIPITSLNNSGFDLSTLIKKHLSAETDTFQTNSLGHHERRYIECTIKSVERLK